MKKISFLNFVCLLFLTSTFAQEGSDDTRFFMEVSADSVLYGNYIEVTFILENGNGSQFEAPIFEGFDVVGGPNQSSSFSMMNGVTTQSLSYSYYLQPKEVGSYFIPPAFITVGEKNYETTPIEIFVLENPDGIISQPKKSRSPFGNNDFFNDDFFQLKSDDFFNFPKRNPRGEIKPQETTPKKKKKKRKVYKI